MESAVVVNGVVTNRIVADPALHPAPPGAALIALPPGSPVAVGWVVCPNKGFRPAPGMAAPLRGKHDGKDARGRRRVKIFMDYDGCEMPEHVNDEPHEIEVLKGSVEITVDGVVTVRDAKSGVFVVPAGKRHGFRAREDDTVVANTFEADPVKP